jgi:hypothetical protein
MIELGQQGPRAAPKCSVPHISYVSTADNKNPHLVPFAQVLIKGCKVSVLLPLLSILDATYPDGEALPSFVLTIVHSISSALLLSESGQRDFVECGGASTMAYLLGRAQAGHLTYCLYLKFITLLKMVTYVPLQRDILDQLLLNTELWVRASGDVQLQITRHWARGLLSQYPDLVKEFRPAKVILDILRVYYWYTPVENTLIFKDRAKDIPIQDVRQNLLHLLHCSAIDGLSKTDFSSLLGHCISCSDPLQVRDLLSFLKLLAVSLDSPLHALTDVWYQFSTLHHLLHHEDELIVFAVVDLFSALHFLGFVEKPKIHHHVDILMDMFSPATLTSKFFMNVLPLAIKYPHFLPICFFKIEQDDVELQSWLTSHLVPDAKFSEPKHWSILPLLGAMRIGGKFLHFVIQFIGESCISNWDSVLAELDFIGDAYNVPCEAARAKSIFLNAVCLNIMKTPALATFEPLHEFFDCAIFFVFFKRTGSLNCALEAEYLRSPFNDTDQTAVRKDAENPMITKATFFSRLKKGQAPGSTYTYGVRMSEDGRWLDHKLALNMIELTKRTKSQTFHNLSALLLGLMAHVVPDEIGGQVASLLAMRVVDPPYADYLNMVAGKARKSGCSFNCFEAFLRDSTPVITSVINAIGTKHARILKFREKSAANQNTIFEVSDDNLLFEASEHMNAIVSDLNRTRNASAREWQSIHQRFTRPSGPWASAGSSFADSRCSTICALEYPAKWKSIEAKAPEPASHRPRVLKRSNTLPVNAGRPRVPSRAPVAFFEVTIANLDGRHQGHMSEETKLEIQAVLVKLESKLQCKFLVQKAALALAFAGLSRKVFRVADIRRIALKLFLHHPIGIELTTWERRVYLIQFTEYQALSVLRLIASLPDFKGVNIQTHDLTKEFSTTQLTENWLKGTLSNLEYLLALNEHSGRTCHCLEMYPVCPWVLHDYKSDRLNLSDDATYRDLSRPLERTAFGFSNKAGVLKYLNSKLPFAAVTPDRFSSAFLSIADCYAHHESLELTPEFFISPEFFTNLDLPPWAHGSAYEFVYQHRKVLEGKFVSEHLHKWIDLVFGVSQAAGESDLRMFEGIWNETTLHSPNERAEIELIKETRGQFPVRLFSTTHPQKTVRTYSQIIPKVINCDRLTDRSPVFTSVKRASERVFIFTSVDKTTGAVYRITANFDTSQFLLREGGTVIAGKHYSSDGIALYSVAADGSVRILDPNTGELQQLQGHTLPGTCIASDKGFLVTGARDSTLRVYSGGKLQNVFVTLRDGATCCAVSEPFSAAVVGTMDNAIVVFELKNGTITQIADLNAATPSKVLITRAWGFILVAAADAKTNQQFLLLYSIGGVLIKRAEVQFQIKCWHGFRSPDGFDFVVASDPNGKISFFEAFYLGVDNVVHDLNKPVTNVFYSVGLQAIFAVGEDSVISVIPFAMPKTTE